MWKKVLGITVLAVAALYLIPPVNQVENHPFYQSKNNAGVDIIAHRGGHGLKPASTVLAAMNAQAMGAVIELDVHATSDGHLIVRHDDTVDATTNGSGLIREKSLKELKLLDAGYTFDPAANESFPYRDTGVTIPTLQELIDATPDARFVMEIKQAQPSITRQLCTVLHDNQLEKRVIVGSFKDEVIDEFRDVCPDIATSMAAGEARTFVIMEKLGLSHLVPVKAQAFQVPVAAGGMTVLTPSFIKAAQNRGMKVEVWTINDQEEMSHLIGQGVDGIITDYPDRLRELL